MNYLDQYKKWMSYEGLDAEIKAELEEIRNDENEIKERFFAPMSFGTAGLRSIIRAGLNGMNIYTVAQATQGLAELVKENGREKDGVVIACDTRIKSELFARTCAEVLYANGIKVYIFDAPRPTPLLSYAIRELKTAAGINITASHNPKVYNGYKAYWADGAQISPEQAKIVSDAINAVDIFTGVRKADFDEGVNKGLIEILGKETDEKYLDVVLSQSVNPTAISDVADTFKVVYTPFHGTGRILIPEALKRAGLKHLYCVQEQMTPDGNFPTVKSPNPEDKEGFNLAIEIAKKEKSDLMIGSDPDADRAGVILRTDSGEFIPLTGNQIGCMLISYIIEARKLRGTLPENACVIKSIVSSPLADAICKKHGVKLMDVLTGFKFIGEKMTEFEETKEYSYIFGFEESYGYLCGNYARDKDAVSACMLIVEMAAFYAKQGKTLYDVLQGIFKEYGCFMEGVQNASFPGIDGAEKMKNLMENLRTNVPSELGGKKVVALEDYLASKRTFTDGKEEEILLPKSNVLCFITECGDKIFVRPSGTEPKVKFYYLVSSESEKSSLDRIEDYKKAVSLLLK